ncbi:hypothetical protein HPB52_009422 [Rhipicephalus sanguineus]|uniref:Uncharacterized protein n=1 Tax=Rhipicephalus sanguineus TaxID=34632 RepID=A0A9D4T938_RHISA|nr:hypothetical protein HPB52_009422 [Rhipicephalus sanguineus]
MGQLMTCCVCKRCSDALEWLRTLVRRLFGSPTPEEEASAQQQSPEQQTERQRGPEEHAAAAETQPSVPEAAVQSPSDSEGGGLAPSVGDTTDTEGLLSAVMSPTSSSLTQVTPTTASSGSREDRAAQDAGSSSGLSSSTLESDALLGAAAIGVKTPP